MTEELIPETPSFPYCTGIAITTRLLAISTIFVFLRNCNELKPSWG